MNIIRPNQNDKPVLISVGQWLQDNWEEMLNLWKGSHYLTEELTAAKNYFQKLAAMKRYYERIYDAMMAHHKKYPTSYYDSYPTDWDLIMTPIEKYAWESFRCKGHVPFYPQYPALNYFLDFANPGYKIGIELDGKEYHNKERDVIRDIELKRAGWSIYRITGKEMYRTNYKEWYDIYGLPRDEKVDCLRDWIVNSGDGVIEAIKQVHFIGAEYVYTDHDESDEEDHSYVYNSYIDLCRESLDLHRS